jgi:hypothetical protein
VRLPAALLVLAGIGVVFGASLIAPWAVGLAVIADSVALGAFALLWDRQEPERRDLSPVAEILERGRNAS